MWGEPSRAATSATPTAYTPTSYYVCEHVARCQLHYCMQCIVLATKDLDESHPVQCTINLHYSFADLYSLARCNWPTQLYQSGVDQYSTHTQPVVYADIHQSTNPPAAPPSTQTVVQTKDHIIMMQSEKTILFNCWFVY